MAHDDEKDPKGEDALPLQVGMKRRNFLKTLLMMGGGAVLYSAPAAKALGAAGAKLATAQAVAIALPASYDVAEVNQVFTIDLPSQPAALQIAFAVSGVVTLNRTTDPKVAQVSLDSLTLRSESANPLGALGYDAGRITASVAGFTDIGTFDMSTGTIAEHDFPLTIKFERNYAPWSTFVNPTGATILQNGLLSSSMAAQQQQQQQQRKCTKKNDVKTPLPGTKPGTDSTVKPLPSGTGRGQLSLGMTPRSAATPVPV